jgi:hypothetical protein
MVVALGSWLGLVFSFRCSISQLSKMAIPRFNFTRLLIDLATAHNMQQPIFIPAAHPFPGHHAFVCQYGGVDAIGGGPTEAAARNTAARQVWIEMGHLITVDPRYLIFLFSSTVVLIITFVTYVGFKPHLHSQYLTPIFLFVHFATFLNFLQLHRSVTDVSSNVDMFLRICLIF